MRKRKIYIALAMALIMSMSLTITVGATEYETIKEYSFSLTDGSDDRVVYEYYITNGVSEIYYQGDSLHAVELIKNLAVEGETITIRAKISMPLTTEQSAYISTCDRVKMDVSARYNEDAIHVTGYYSADSKYYDNASAYNLVMLGYEDNLYNGLVLNSNSNYESNFAQVYIRSYQFENMMPKETRTYQMLNIEYVFVLENIAHNGLQFNLYWDDMNVDVVCEYLNAVSVGNVNNVISNLIVQEQTQVIKSQTDKIINQGNTIIQPNQGDIVDINNMQFNVSNRQEQSEQLVEDIKVNKPTITDELLNPVDDVDDESLDTMGGVLGAVFVSPTLGSIAVMALVFGLIGYILYGKR